VFPYFGEAEVRRLVLVLQERFPGAALVFDAMTPFMAWLHSRHPAISKLHTNLWGIKRGQELETWSPGIRLLDEWFYFDRPEPRLGQTRLMRFVPLLNKGSSIVHYRLGSARIGG
jgi:O-methyltransferase involved in polyketide biosynthesis